MGKVCVDCKAVASMDDYMLKFRPDLMEAVMAWSKGASFMDVIKMVDTYEVRDAHM